MCVQKCPLLTSRFVRRPECKWSKEALSHEVVGGHNCKSHTGCPRPPALVGGKADLPAGCPLARPLRSEPVEAALRPLCPPLPPRILHTAKKMWGRNVLRGRAWKHGGVPFLPCGSADIGGMGDHAGLGPDPHRHFGLDMSTHTTLTSTCATPCHLLQAPLSSMWRPMVTSLPFWSVEIRSRTLMTSPTTPRAEPSY